MCVHWFIIISGFHILKLNVTRMLKSRTFFSLKTETIFFSLRIENSQNNTPKMLFSDFEPFSEIFIINFMVLCSFLFSEFLVSFTCFNINIKGRDLMRIPVCFYNNFETQRFIYAHNWRIHNTAQRFRGK